MGNRATPEQLAQLQPIVDRLAACTALDATGQPRALGTELARGATLVMFVRQFGCIGCHQQMTLATPLLGEVAEYGVRSIVIGCGPSDYLPAFLAEYHLAEKGVMVLTDPSLRCFDAAALRRSFWDAWGPRGGWDFLAAAARGYALRGFWGNTGQHGGTLLIDGPAAEQRLRFHYSNSHLTDMAPLHEVMEASALWLAKQMQSTAGGS